MTDDLESRAWTRKGKYLYPSDIHAEEMLNSIKEGKEVLVRISKPRNPRQHRLLFALLRKVVENSEVWKSERELLSAVKLATGISEVYKDIYGELYTVPCSISFASMPQSEFEDFFSKAIYILSNISGIPEDVLLKETIDATTSSRRMDWGK